jgi:hypothetical protein
MTYFREVSDLLYQSQQTNRNSSYDYARVKNLFRRAKIRDDFFQNATAFTKYKIIGEERPDQVAEKIYGSSEYDWVVLISNNILNTRTEWPLSDAEFSNYLERKYTEAELASAHHYETTLVTDSMGKMIVPAGKIVDPNFTVTYIDEGLSIEQSVNINYVFSSTTTKFDSVDIKFDSAITETQTIGTMVTKTPVKMVSIYEYEIQQNDKKRNIYLLRPRYLQTAIDDMRRIMSYGFSSQYVDDLTKKGESSRVLSPR